MRVRRHREGLSGKGAVPRTERNESRGPRGDAGPPALTV